MPQKMCKGCKQLWHKERLYRNLCPTCRSLAEIERGSRRERGIGPNHEALARALRTDPAAYSCSICGVNGADSPLTVGHIVPRVRCLAIGKDPDSPANMQPECRRCNLRKSNDR